MKMMFGCFSAALFLILFSLTVQAHPVATLSAGADFFKTHMNQNVTFIAPFQNNYVSNNHSTDFVGGVFLGIEKPVFENILGQLGVSYYQNDVYQVRGIVYQFADPAMGNLNYQYNIQSQRILLESKLLGTFREKYHPLLNVGVGAAINTASQYTETPVISSAVPMPVVFGDKTTHALTYLIGVGVEMDIDCHFRLGGVYRYVNLGRAQLTTAPLQEDSNVLKNNPFYVNEFLLQLSYQG